MHEAHRHLPPTEVCLEMTVRLRLLGTDEAPQWTELRLNLTEAERQRLRNRLPQMLERIKQETLRTLEAVR